MEQFKFTIPKGFPEVDFPDDNEFTWDRWKLGKTLFFDKALSRDNSISCASCHKPNLAFSDDVQTSDGVEGRPGTRNSPTLCNVAYQPYYTREGGVPTLEMQVLVPIQEHNEFDFNIIKIQEKLQADSLYAELSRNAYGKPLDYYVITRALANFERSILSGNSRFDKFRNGAESALNEDQKAGWVLFNSNRTNCSTCHSGFNFTNYAFENNGLHEEYEDSGRMRLTSQESDDALFKVPTLRNIELTAPYMHDGSLETLADVVEHYNSGGNGHKNQSEFVRPLNLSEKEKEQLISFLKALTDFDLITNKHFQE